MPNITRYNAKECTVMVGNVYITGLAEDMVKGEKTEDFFETSVGAQGDTVASEINNPLGEFTVTVQCTSPQKKYLMDLADSNDFVSVWAINKNLGERFGGSKAKLKKYPSRELGATAGDLEFTFGVFDYVVDTNVE